MIEKMLAKPNKTIREHTDDLKKNAKELLIYGYIDEKMYNLLEIACEYHDYGKANEEFQKRVTSNKKLKFNNEKEIAHNILSIYSINPEIFSNRDDYLRVCYAVGNHHHNTNNYDEILNKKKLIDQYLLFNNLKNIGIRTVQKIFEKNELEIDGKKQIDIVTAKLKGFLHKCDYSASGNFKIEYPNNFLNNSLENLNFKWNDLQLFAIKNTNESIIAVANTGMGKTEAGLLWIGNNKGFFILPVKTALNAIYNRIIKNIIDEKIENKVSLLHSESLEYYFKETVVGEDKILEYRNRGKNLSIPLTISTLDQLFNFVYKYNGFEIKLATLSYSKIVIDEIQAYSPDLLAYLIYGLECIHQAGGKFAILTATFPPFIREALEKNITNIKFKNFTVGEDRHNVKVIDEVIKSCDIYDHYLEKKGKTLVICNTVKEAQKLFKELEIKFKNKKIRIKVFPFNSHFKVILFPNKRIVELQLLHSKFIKRDRNKKETLILDFGRTENIKEGIWISTSLVEASLDIDFDYLFTELNDLCGFFQRLGRINRKGKKRSMLKAANAYIFTKISKNLFINESGKKGFIDKDIFDISKKALEEVNGILPETLKSDLVEKYLTSENIENSNFKKRYELIKSYIENLYIGEKEFTKVQKEFRNINSYYVIPENIFNKNKDIIIEIAKIINDKSSSQILIAEKRSELNSYTVSVGYYDLNKTGINIQLPYDIIEIIKCEYSEKYGFERIKKEKIEEVFDSFI